MLKIALFVHSIIIFCELYTLGHIRRKTDLLKYYTYLQNFLTLFVSFVFFVYLVMHLVSEREIPAVLKGLRYTVTCGLVAAMFIFLVVLGAGKKMAITEDDFLGGFSPKMANAILHYICPALSLISFVLFEKELPLSNGIWTSIAAIPSCLYWIIYMILSATNLWEEPYPFAAQGGKGKMQEVLLYCLVPLSFVAISFVLWTMK